MLKVAVADMSEMYALCVLCQFICNRHSPPRKLATGSLFFRYLGASSVMVYFCHYLSFCDSSVRVFSRIHAVKQPAAANLQIQRRRAERACLNSSLSKNNHAFSSIHLSPPGSAGREPLKPGSEHWPKRRDCAS